MAVTAGDQPVINGVMDSTSDVGKGYVALLTSGTSPTVQWEDAYGDGSSHRAGPVAVDQANGIIYSGFSILVSGFYDHGVRKYDLNGNMLAEFQYGSVVGKQDYLSDIVVDQQTGNIYILG